jgi:hypothetical protein
MGLVKIIILRHIVSLHGGDTPPFGIFLSAKLIHLVNVVFSLHFIRHLQLNERKAVSRPLSL